ncbi:hypothetical protein SK128_016245, partial [Halocaridina rubra]
MVMDNGYFSNMQQHLEQGAWEKLSPRRLEHRVYVPSAITLHRLVPRKYPSKKSDQKRPFSSFK